MNSAANRVFDEDSWLRHIIENGAIRSTTPRVRTAYLVKHLQDGLQPGGVSSEISGRLLSLANDVAEYAKLRAAERKSDSIKFRGVIIASVAALRTLPTVDVIADPDDDQAHANLVVMNVPMAATDLADAPSKISNAFIDALAKLFAVYDASLFEA